jgi:dipeptidyl aminopeptidase/acylaminoacyl peptidase
MRSAAVAALAALSLTSVAQQAGPLNKESYIKPPGLLEQALLTPWYTHVNPVSWSPKNNAFLDQDMPNFQSLDDRAAYHINLGGMDFDPMADRLRSLSTGKAIGWTVHSHEHGTVKLQTPKGAWLSSVTWSADGTKLLVVVSRREGSTLAWADPTTGDIHPMSSRRLLLTGVTQPAWIGSTDKAAVILAPRIRKGMTAWDETPSSPQVRVSRSGEDQIRTFQDLLEGPQEARTLEHLMTGQLAIIDADGRVTEIGEPRMYNSIDPSSTGDAFIAGWMEGPFPYLRPVRSSTRVSALIGADGKVIEEISKTLSPEVDKPEPKKGAKEEEKPEDKRFRSWRADGAGLAFVQKSKKDKDDKESKQKDRLMLATAPYGEGDAKVIFETEITISQVIYTDDGKSALIRQSDKGTTTYSMVDLAKGEANKVLDYKSSGSSNPGRGPGGRPGGRNAGGQGGPGSPVTAPGAHGESALVVSSDGGSIYFSGTLSGEEAKKQGRLNYIDRVALADGKKTRLFISKTGFQESARLLNNDATRIGVSRQSKTEPSNLLVFEPESKKETAITHNKNLLPDYSNLRTEEIEITRADGFKFHATVTFPKFFYGGEGRRAMFWFYPSEYTDQAAYDQRHERSANDRFVRPRSLSPRLLALLGYVVVEPECPIVGPRERPNNTFVHQLRNNLSATIDALEAKDYIDRRLLALGGHSYGAFGTANAMVHTPFFKAGIAGDGNYNRSLTPFGFQREPRKLWEAREIYYQMSPLWHAEQMTGALLMYHGIEDQNVGTFPIHSPRMFAALEALDKEAALYMYPYEDHGPRSQETVLDIWARWTAWLDRHLVLPENKPTN